MKGLGNFVSKGMSRETPAQFIKQGNYVFAYNGVYLDDEGGQYVILTNEPSNFPCKRFENKYIVGYGYNRSTKDLILFLKDKETGVSEIGRIKIKDSVDIPIKKENCSDCDEVYYQDFFLENSDIDDLCDYEVLLEDSCNKCLNFSIDYPIYSVVFKKEKTGLFVYWTDGLNPPRVLNLDKLSDYKEQGIESCDTTTTPVCVDCEKLRIFKKYAPIDFADIEIMQGGVLEEGAYQLFFVYTDEVGNELGEYMSATNPIYLKGDNFIKEDNKYTNKAIQIKLSHIDKNVRYYKIGILFTSSFDNVSSFYETDAISTDTKLYLISDLGVYNKSNLKKVFYKGLDVRTAKFLVTGGNRLFLYNLKLGKRYNLQPIANLMGAFLRWRTAVARGNFYEYEKNASLYKGRMRDEVYTYSIRFIKKSGGTTPLYFLSNRPSNEYENGYVSNDDTTSLNSYVKVCNNKQFKRWELYDTSEILGNCPAPTGVEYNTYTDCNDRYCSHTVGVFDTSGVEIDLNIFDSRYFSIANGDVNELIKNWLNSNLLSIITNFGYYYNETLANIFNNLPPGCSINVDEGCSITSEEVVKTFIENVYGGYIRYNASFVSPRVIINPDDSVTRIYFTSLASSDNPYDKIGGSFQYDSVLGASLTYNDSGSCKKVAIRKNYINRTYQNAYEVGILNPNTLTLQPPKENDTFYFDYRQFLDDTQFEIGEYVIDDVSEKKVFFPNKIKKNANWFKVNTSVPVRFVISRFAGVDTGEDYLVSDSLHYGKPIYRVSIFNSNFDLLHSEVVYGDHYNSYDFDTTDYLNQDIYISVEAPIVLERRSNCNGDETFLRPAIYGGYFQVGILPSENSQYSMSIGFDSIDIWKTKKFNVCCDVEYPKDKGCELIPDKYGKFGIFLSEEEYPDNKELFDSRSLKINVNEIPLSIKNEFIDYFYANTDDDGNMTLNDNANLTCGNLRLYKYPSNKTVPFVSNVKITDSDDVLIFPVGLYIDDEVVEYFLKVAVDSGLITQDEKDDIIGYEIFEGDRSVSKSILAKGILFDMYKYKDEDNNEVYYPNYPFNDLGDDYMHKDFDGIVKHPFNGDKNNKFTFISPDIYFEDINPQYFKNEGEYYGFGYLNETEVKEHPKVVLLTPLLESIVFGLGLYDTYLDLIDKVLRNMSQGVTGLAVGVASLPMYFMWGYVGVLENTYKWRKLFKELLNTKNYGYYSYGVGYYRYFKTESVTEGNETFGIEKSSYLKDGRFATFVDNKKVTINNYNREKSLFLSFGNYDLDYNDTFKNYDDSRKFDLCKKHVDINVSSIYGSVRRFLPSQYGNIYDIRWLSTGKRVYFGDDNSCNIIWGGDTFITKFTKKRKFPFFLENAVGLPDRTAFAYSFYNNIGLWVKYYADMDMTFMDYSQKASINKTVAGFDLIGEMASILLPFQHDRYNLKCDGKDYLIHKNGRFLLFSYGFVDFYVESTRNTNYREQYKDVRRNIYPLNKDLETLTQESIVSIKEDEVDFYNTVFSKNSVGNIDSLLESVYNKEYEEKITNDRNGVVYSEIDLSEARLTDTWQVFRPYNYHTFDADLGDLQRLVYMGNYKMIGLFSDNVNLFSLEANNKVKDTIFGGGLFVTIPINYDSIQTGFIGSDNYSYSLNKFGLFFHHSDKGVVYNISTSFKPTVLNGALDVWFKSHLKRNIETDNVYKGYGFSYGYDSKYDRVFLTKKDYRIKDECKDRFTEIDGILYIDGVHVEPKSSDCFENVDFTVAYSPLTKGWISYYGFKPNFYVDLDNKFITGLSEEGSLWLHLISNKSYQVFYGELTPFIVEVPLFKDFTPTILESLTFGLDVKMYHDKNNYNLVRDYMFDKMYIYNDRAYTGKRDVYLAKRNDIYGLFSAKKRGDITVSCEDEMCSAVGFYDLEKSDMNNNLLWKWDYNKILKEDNFWGLKDIRLYKQKLTGTNFVVGFENNKESRYSITLKFLISKNVVK